MADFESAVNFVLKNEGLLNENPKDKGGLTKYGISLRFLKTLSADDLKKCGIEIEVSEDTIRNLTINQAKQLYYFQFWLHAPFSQILYQEHANYLFDMAVNLGIAPAIKCIQRACWAVMKKWELLHDDGILGSNTLAAIEKCGFLLLPALRAERGNYYRNIVNRDPEQMEFLKGWYDRTYNV